MNRIINSISDRNRQGKYDIFLQRFNPDENTRILDVGASEREYRSTSNYLEKKYSYPENITVLGVDGYKGFCLRYPEVSVVKYGGGLFPFKDKSFDICWCNAVIEHVGSRSRQKVFLSEILRVSKRAFITTPNKYFIFEVHTKMLFLHYLPKKIFDKILIKIGKPWAAGNYMHLLGRRDLVDLLDTCGMKDYEIIKNKIMGFTIDYVLIL